MLRESGACNTHGLDRPLSPFADGDNGRCRSDTAGIRPFIFRATVPADQTAPPPDLVARGYCRGEGIAMVANQRGTRFSFLSLIKVNVLRYRIPPILPTMPDKLARICTDALRNGVDFPTLWETVLKSHPLVAGGPIQRLAGSRPYLEVPLTMGRCLMIDGEAKTAELGYRS